LFRLPPLALLAWLHAYQPNKLAWGGARHGGKRRAAPQAALLSRWVVIEKILTHLDAKAAEPQTTRLPPCRSPPQARLFG